MNIKKLLFYLIQKLYFKILKNDRISKQHKKFFKQKFNNQ